MYKSSIFSSFKIFDGFAFDQNVFVSAGLEILIYRIRSSSLQLRNLNLNFICIPSNKISMPLPLNGLIFVFTGLYNFWLFEGIYKIQGHCFSLLLCFALIFQWRFQLLYKIKRHKFYRK